MSFNFTHFSINLSLDYNELYRDLQDIFVISRIGIDFDARQLQNSEDEDAVESLRN
jgi:hypothetical protein